MARKPACAEGIIRMNMRTGLMVGAALGAVLLAACPPAEAKTTHKKRAAGPSEAAVLTQEVQELKAQVQALTSRLDAQASAQQQTQAQAQAAQAQAQTAQSTAQAAQSTAQAAQTQADNNSSEIKTIPGTVEKQAKASKGGWWSNGWWGDTKIGGSMFADFSYIHNSNAAGKTAQSGPGFDIKRLYIIIDHRFNDTYSFNVTTDFTYDNNTTVPTPCITPGNPVGCTTLPPSNTPGGANTAGGIKSTQLFLKKAYLQASYADYFNIRLGGAELPWVPFVEGLYPYRFAEKMLIDRTGYGTTTDWGVHVFGNVLDHIVSYQFSVVDGEGFKQPSLGNVNRTNAMDFEGRVSASYMHVTAAIGGYYGKLGNNVNGVYTFNDAQRIDALLAYTNDRFRLGGEYLWARYWKDVTQPNPAKTNETKGYGLFGAYNLTPMFSLFGRYDWIKPSSDTAPTLTQNYYNFGIDYKPINQLDLALVYKRDNVYNGSFTDANGVVGIPTGAHVGRGNYDEIGLFTWVRF
jgi:hypothetical protein